MAGEVINILITAKEGGDIVAQDSAELHTGKGIVGDRYYGLSEEDNVTLINLDELDGVRAGKGLATGALIQGPFARPRPCHCSGGAA